MLLKLIAFVYRSTGISIFSNYVDAKYYQQINWSKIEEYLCEGNEIEYVMDIDRGMWECSIKMYCSMRKIIYVV